MTDVENVPGVERHYSTVTVAGLFDVKAETVRLWISNGLIKARKINGAWRIPQSEVERLGTQRYGRPDNGE